MPPQGEISEAERKMQERLAAYKKKMEAKKSAEAGKKEEEQRKKDEKKKKRLEAQAKTQQLIEDEKRKAKEKMEEVKNARLAALQRSKDGTTKPEPRRGKMQRQKSKTLMDEHGVMLEAEKTFEKQEQVMASRLNQYKQKLEERKKKEAAEAKKEEEKKQAEKRKREEEAETERKKVEEQLAAMKEKSKGTAEKKAAAPRKFGGGAPAWAAKNNNNAAELQAQQKMQATKVKTWREKQDEKKKKEAEEKAETERQAEKERQDAMKKMNMSMSVMEDNSVKDDFLKGKTKRKSSKIAVKPINTMHASFNTPADFDWKKKKNDSTIGTKKKELERLAEERTTKDAENRKAKEDREEAVRKEAEEKKRLALEKERAEVRLNRLFDGCVCGCVLVCWKRSSWGAPPWQLHSFEAVTISRPVFYSLIFQSATISFVIVS